MSLQPGQHLLHYRLLEPIGEGGMGVVWKAVDTTLDREVAVKLLPDAFATDAERMTRFEREAKLLAAQNHPNIAGIHGLHEADGRRFLTLELVPGVDLAERLETGPLPLDEAIRVARQIARGLEAAHENGVVHRDLKPANVKLAPDGAVKILDFGLAKAMEDEPGDTDVTRSPTLTAAATRAGVILGTAAYMSPEQARGLEVDRRADIWAFGVVLYEMLAGKRMYDGGTVTDILAAVLMKEPDWETLPDGTPPRLRRLLRRCLRKDPRSRLRDIGDARIVLEEILAGDDPEEPATIAAPPGAGPRRGSHVAWTVAGVAVALAAAVMILWTSTGSREMPVVRFSLEGQQVPLLLSENSLAEHPAVALSPDGSMMALTTVVDGDTAIRLRPLDSFDARLLPGTEGGRDPVFSPDGEWICFATDTRLLKVPINGGPVVELAQVDTNSRGTTWTDDGWIVFQGQATGGLQKIPAVGGRPEALTELDANAGERTHRWPQALPGGRAVLFTVGSLDSPEFYDDAVIDVVEIDSGRRRRVLEGASLARYAPDDRLVFARAGSLFAVPFDAQSLQVKGTPRPVMNDVLSWRNSGAAHFSISSTGTLAYLEGHARQEKRSLVWYDPDGRREVLDVPRHNYMAPNLAPDGRRVALTVIGDRNTDIWVYDLERRVMSRVTFDGVESAGIWSPDGRWLYFNSIRNNRWVLLRQRADGTGESETLHEDQVRIIPNAVSSDGSLLIFERQPRPSSGDIHFLDLETNGPPQSFLDSRFDEWGATLSPDGRWLAYVSDETGRGEVFVRGIGAQGGKWQISTGGGTEPRWSGSGTELFFLQDQTFMRVPVDVESGFRVGGAQPMFESTFEYGFPFGPRYDVDPTGERLLVLQPEAEETRTSIRVVLNWTSELSP